LSIFGSRSLAQVQQGPDVTEGGMTAKGIGCRSLHVRVGIAQAGKSQLLVDATPLGYLRAYSQGVYPDARILITTR